MPEFAGQAWVDATQAVGIGRTPWHLLVGTLNGEPVCCGLLTCGAGVAGLLGLGTLPAHRRKGIGSAMQLERLRIARDLGYRYGGPVYRDIANPNAALVHLMTDDLPKAMGRFKPPQYQWRESKCPNPFSNS